MSAQNAPTRSNRQRCWDSRDTYYACLTNNKILAPPGTDMSDIKGPLGRGAFAAPTMSEAERAQAAEKDRQNDPCASLRDTYEGSCSRSWIDYFNKRRILEERQKTYFADTEARINSRK